LLTEEKAKYKDVAAKRLAKFEEDNPGHKHHGGRQKTQA
jgi:hypothetical protein